MDVYYLVFDDLEGCCMGIVGVEWVCVYIEQCFVQLMLMFLKGLESFRQIFLELGRWKNLVYGINVVSVYLYVDVLYILVIVYYDYLGRKGC